MRPDKEGNELFLYHLELSNTCALTVTCCVGNTKSEIPAVTNTSVKLLMIPVAKMEEWSSKYKTWHNFFFASYHTRVMELLESIDNITFDNMDERLESNHNDKIKILNSKHIYITHKDIAADLNTSCVVISRLLKKMENTGKIELHHSFIEIL
jgi:CRP/FNR family transcriptional regulator